MLTRIKDRLRVAYPSVFEKSLVFKTMGWMQKSGQLAQDGWFRSVREHSSVDAEGQPLPWITYPAIEFLKKRVKPGFHVFEFGCGASTMWWAKRVAKVVSVEHEKAWYDLMKPKLPPNAELSHVDLVPGGEYSRKAAAGGGAYDVIVVDGRDRVNCALNSLPALREDGIILWDNSERERYAEGQAALIAKGFRKLEFTGMTPLQVEKSETGIFYRDRNCLGI